MSLSITEGNFDLALVAQGGEAFDKRLQQLTARKEEADAARRDAVAAHDRLRAIEAERAALKQERERLALAQAEAGQV